MTGNAQRGTSSAVLDNLNVPRLKKSFLQKAGCIPRTLQDQFAKLPGFLEHWRPGEPPTTQSRFDCSFANGMADEVSEYRGILLVRLGAGFVMQVRLQAQGKAVLTRTMPIAKALRIEADPPWEIASPGSLRVWSQSHSPIWQWLQGKGIQGGAPTESGAITDTGAATRRLAEDQIAAGFRRVTSPVHPDLVCSKCQWKCLLPSRRRTSLDFLLALFLLRPYRCRSCHRRYYRLSFSQWQQKRTDSAA
jgi:hypothetical protein